MESQRHQPKQLCGIPEQRADADRILQGVGAADDRRGEGQGSVGNKRLPLVLTTKQLP